MAKRKRKKKGSKGQTWKILLAGAIVGLFLIFGISLFERLKMILDSELNREPKVTYSFEKGAEIPELMESKAEQIIRQEGYTVSYNPDYKIANWVAYELTDEEAASLKTERTNKFVYDPAIDRNASASNEDYSRSGYDRGHLAPAGDMKWSAKAMRESFYLTNICPQHPKLNKGEWKDLEELIRTWAKEHGSLYIVCGPVIKKEMRRLGKNRVGIPEQFYKVICNPKQGECIAFLFENSGHKPVALRKLAVTVDSVEKITGIDFFPQFPDDLENKMEAEINLKKWRLGY